MGREGKSGASTSKGKGKAKASTSFDPDVYEESLEATNVRLGLEDEANSKPRMIVYDRKIIIPKENRDTPGCSLLYGLKRQRNWRWFSSKRFKGYDMNLVKEFYIGYTDREANRGHVHVYGKLIPWSPEDIDR